MLILRRFPGQGINESPQEFISSLHIWSYGGNNHKAKSFIIIIIFNCLLCKGLLKLSGLFTSVARLDNRTIYTMFYGVGLGISQGCPTGQVTSVGCQLDYLLVLLSIRAHSLFPITQLSALGEDHSLYTNVSNKALISGIINEKQPKKLLI